MVLILELVVEAAVRRLQPILLAAMRLQEVLRVYVNCYSFR